MPELLVIRPVRFTAEHEDREHAHAFGKLVLGVKGSCLYRVAGREQRVDAGRHLYLAPGAMHACRVDGPSEFLDLRFHPPAGQREEERLFRHSFSFADSRRIGARKAAREMLAEARARRPGATLCLQALLAGLLVRLLRGRGELAPLRLAEPAVPAGPPDRVDLALRFIAGHFHENIGLADIARAAHFSPGHLGTLFRERTGRTPIQHLTALRLEKAKELITTSDHSLTKIASLVGYSSLSYFDRVFRRSEGLAPSQLLE